ncbi:MAG: hypothetical protein ABI165_15070 [Bryobacteraceae bacterium]
MIEKQVQEKTRRLPSRRHVLASVISGAASLNLSAAAHNEKLKLGVASYSLRKFSRQQAIPMLRQFRVRYLSIKEAYLPNEDSPQALTLGHQEFDEASFTILGGGVVVTYHEDNSQLRKYFDYAKVCRFPTRIMMSAAAQLPTIERLAQEYNIRIAIHNHGPEDRNFPTRKSVYDAIHPFDHRVGVCIDVGHTARAGADVVESIDWVFGSPHCDAHQRPEKYQQSFGLRRRVRRSAHPANIGAAAEAPI